MAVAVAQVEHRITQTRHGAVRPYLIQPHRDVRDRFVCTHFEVQDGCADKVDVLGQRCAVEGQRARIVAALVARELGPSQMMQYSALSAPTALRRRQRTPAGLATVGRQTVAVEVQAAHLEFVGWPGPGR